MDAMAHPNDWVRSENAPDNDWSRSVSSMAYLNHAMAIVVFARDTDAVMQISARRPDVSIIAVCDNNLVANQLCLLRGVIPIYTPDSFALRDIKMIAKITEIKSGKLVIVDGDEVSLRDLD